MLATITFLGDGILIYGCKKNLYGCKNNSLNNIKTMKTEKEVIATPYRYAFNYKKQALILKRP